LAYFVWLSTSPLEEIDFQLMEQYLADGADVNAATKTGASIIHDVASNWDTTVAEFLFKRGANIHAVNSSGQTPLHLAASTDHIEMVRWLLEKGAHLDAMTSEELQSPLHYAARNDSLEALQVLIENGGKRFFFFSTSYLCIHFEKTMFVLHYSHAYRGLRSPRLQGAYPSPPGS
jgi:ankyrin repeat protein